MAATELATAYVQIIPSADGISGKITEALGGEAKSAGESAGSAAGSSMVGTVAKVIGGSTAAVGAASAGMFAAFVKGSKDVASYGDNVDKMSQKIGLSAEEYQKWAYVMERAGTNVDVMKNGMKTLSSAVESNSDAFQKLGISQQDAANMSQGELFQTTIEALAGMEAGTERTTLATQLLGKAGTELGPLLNGGTEAISEQMEMAERYGMVMSDESVAASAAFTDSMTTMQYTLTGMRNSMIADFLPSVTQVTDGLALLFSGDTSGVDQINEGIQGIVDGIAEKLPTILAVGKDILTAVAESIIANLPDLVTSATGILTELAGDLIDALPQLADTAVQIITALVTGISESLPVLIPAAVDAVATIVQGLIDNIPQLIGAAAQLLEGLLEGIIAAVPVLIDAAPEIVDSLINAIIELVPLIVTCGVDLLTALITNLPEIITKIGEAAPKIVSSIVSGFKKLFTDIKDVGVDLFESLVGNLPAAVATIVGKVPEVVGGIIDAFAKKIDDFKSMGGNLLLGLADGIAGAVGDTINRAVDALGGVVDSIKRFFGIASPSKMFIGFGRFLDEGLAIGIADNMQPVERAMDDMARLASQSYESTVSMAADSVSGTLELLPSRSAVSQDSNDESARVMDRIYALLVQIHQDFDGLSLVLDSGELVGGIAGKLNDYLGDTTGLSARGV